MAVVSSRHELCIADQETCQCGYVYAAPAAAGLRGLLARDVCSEAHHRLNERTLNECIAQTN